MVRLGARLEAGLFQTGCDQPTYVRCVFEK